MKLNILFMLMACLMVSCGSGSTSNKAQTGEAESSAVIDGNTTGERNVDLSASGIHWKGFKPGGGHHGTISLKKGTLMLRDNAITGGNFVVDMNSIVCEDLEDAESNGKLVGHLKSPDFFDVEKYPEGVFTITSVNGSGDQLNVTGNLTLKDVTKSITFPAMVSGSGPYTVTVPAFTIDRTQWNVNYGSKNIFKNLKDQFINDEIEISVKIVTE